MTTRRPSAELLRVRLGGIREAHVVRDPALPLLVGAADGLVRLARSRVPLVDRVIPEDELHYTQRPRYA